MGGRLSQYPQNRRFETLDVNFKQARTLFEGSRGKMTEGKHVEVSTTQKEKAQRRSAGENPGDCYTNVVPLNT